MNLKTNTADFNTLKTTTTSGLTTRYTKTETDTLLNLKTNSSDYNTLLSTENSFVKRMAIYV